MDDRGDEVHITEESASGGSKEGVVRYVLIIGTFLAIAALTVIWVTGAATQGDSEEEATVSGKIEAQQDGAATDTIVGGETDDLASEGADVEMQDGLEVVENNPTEGKAQ